MYGLDLFSGIGGLTKALDGYVQPVAYCEIDPYARGVLLSRMYAGDLPLAPIWDDVSSLRGALLPHIDIIYGGFPCQDISVAGKQVGLGGKRSGLFFEIVRLVSEIKPTFIFLENVSNIRTKGLGSVLKELDKLRYDCRWGLLSAADMGANHKRERWFLLAHANGGGLPESYICKKQSGRAEVICTGEDMPYGESTKKDINEVADADDTGQRLHMPGGAPQDRGARASQRSDWWDVEPNVGRVANGIPKRVDRLRALGNAVVPQQAREAFELLMGLRRH